MILQVSGGKISNCFCDTLLFDNYALVFLSIFGSTNSVRTIWARLRENYGNVEVGSQTIYLHKGFRYIKMQSPLKSPGTSHLVMLEEKATHQVNSASEFYQIGENSNVEFFSRLDRLCNVPFRKEWASFLWEKGIEKKIILPLNGFGVPGYSISAENKQWSDIVLEGLDKKEIS